MSTPKFSKIGTAAIASHLQFTDEASVTLTDGRRINVPLDRSDTRLDWYWIQVTHAVEKFLAESPVMKSGIIPPVYAADTCLVCNLADADFRLGGYFDDLARANGYCSGKSVADELGLWDMTVADAAKLIAPPISPSEMMIEDHLQDQYIGKHRFISMEITRSVHDLLAAAAKSDHWHDLADEKRKMVDQLLTFHSDYVWTPTK